LKILGRIEWEWIGGCEQFEVKECAHAGTK
jgi:hypothetical protein